MMEAKMELSATTPLMRTSPLILILLVFPSLLVAQSGTADYVRDHYAKQEQMIEMRDGSKLFTAIYTPKDTSRPYPIMLARSPYSSGPYGKDRMKRRLGPSVLFTKAGFIFVYQDVRGKYLSEGDFVPVRPHIPNKKGKEFDESSDTYDTIEWLLANVPNNNGRVGTWGISAPGFYTTHTAIEAHPALKAASPQAPVTDWWLGDDRHHNGALMYQASFSFVPSYGAVRPEPSTRGTRGFRDYNSQDGYRWYLDLGPVTTLNEKYLHHKNPLWNDLMEHEDYDAWWQARTPLPHLNNVKAAILTVGGFFDAQDLYGPLKTYQAFEKRNPKGTNNLVMGPWSHGGWSRGDGDRYEAITFDQKTGPFYREKIEFPFFTHHLKEEGKLDLPEATIFVTGSNEWHEFDRWPPPKAPRMKLYVHADGDVSFSKPKGKGGYDEYVSDP
ncbi:MAG: CocE/NonD family hydrolase, partial [Planctomycetes bacterium]|nr:CocE/NonD family hydrolase [Planctomycetota bacterium]